MNVMSLRESLIKAKDNDRVVLCLEDGTEIDLVSVERFPKLLMFKTKISLYEIGGDDWVDAETVNQLHREIERLEAIIVECQNEIESIR